MEQEDREDWICKLKGKLEKQYMSVSTDHNYARQGLDIEVSSDSELSDIA